MGIMAEDVQSTEQTHSKEDRMSIMSDAIDSLWQQGEITSIPTFSKHRIFRDFPGLPANTQLAWFKIPGKLFGIALGLCKDDGKHFRQLAIADKDGRVYTGDKVTPVEAIERIPQLSFIEQGSFNLYNKTRFYGLSKYKHHITLQNNYKAYLKIYEKRK